MAIGIIAEYNPFHAGHEYQISQARKIFADAEIVAVMSGSFTQRGTPAFLDKWTRARLAISGGVDLVLELPFTSAVRSAQDFARGGVRILSRLGIIDKLVFGAEVADLSALQAAAKIFDEEFFHDELRGKMAAGISYAAAVTKILSRVTTLDEEIFRQPNNILAVEYLRALPESISPVLIPRIGASYGDLSLREKFSSAAAIRAAVREKNPEWGKISASVNKKSLDELKLAKENLIREELLFRPILSKIFTSRLEDLREIFGMVEGLEFRIIDAARSAKNFDELIKKIVSRRYPTSRVKRLLLHLLIGLTAEEISQVDDFARVLAFNERGRILLKRIRAESTLPIVTKVAQHLTSRDILENRLVEPYKKNLALDVVATDLRGILFDCSRPAGQDFLTSPIFLS